MIYKKVILVLFITLGFNSLYAQSTDIQKTQHDSIEHCFKDKNFPLCRGVAASGWLKSNKNLQEKILRFVCEQDPEDSCVSLYFFGKEQAADKQKAINSYILEKCNKDAKFCSAVSQMYEEQKDYKKTLFYGRKYYSSQHKGVFPYKEYLYGNKTDAFKLSLQSCESKEDYCTFYIRYMPDHPQLARLAELAENSCTKELVPNMEGATDCAILGSFYFKRHDIPHAQKLWGLDCDNGNSVACLLILGSSPSEDLRVQAFENYCKRHLGQTGGEAKLQQSDCNDATKSSGRAPAAIRNLASDTLKSYLNEQK